MKEVFTNCFSLEELPDISTWNTSNVVDMTSLFENCTSLVKIPNIIKWDVHNLKSMNYILFNCTSLASFPDISQWDIPKDMKSDNIFDNSISSNLLSLNSDLKDNIKSLSEGFMSNNNSENSLLDNKNNNNIGYNIDYFDKQDNDNNNYYEEFYL